MEFGICPCRSSCGTLETMASNLRGVYQSLRSNSGIVSRFGHLRFLRNPFQFIIRLLSYYRSPEILTASKTWGKFDHPCNILCRDLLKWLNCHRRLTVVENCIDFHLSPAPFVIPNLPCSPLPTIITGRLCSA
jgi:hypothetical protein